MNHKRINEYTWHQFGAKLIEKDQQDNIVNLQLQKEFLKKSQNNDGLVSLLKEHNVSFIDGESIDLPYNEMTEKEFLGFNHYNHEFKAWENLNKLPMDLLVDHGFWAQVIIDLIDLGMIKPSHLAAKKDMNGNHKNGKDEISNALKNEDDKTMNSTVRRILRSWCNGEPRGKRILYYDFPLGRSYWKLYWCDKLAKILNKDMKEVYDIIPQKIYQRLTEKLHTGKSYLSYLNLYAGLVLFLEKHSDKVDETKLSKIVDTMSHVVAWKSLETQSPQENLKVIEIIFKGVKK